MQFPLKIVDAFTLKGQAFTGNPAAVCLLDFDDDISDDIKQKIATDINLSETVFVSNTWNKGLKVEENCYTIRWFTPKREIVLCGHATLASASVLFDNKSKNSLENKYKIKFETKLKGSLEAIVDPNEKTFTLDFPVSDCQPIDCNTYECIPDIIHSIFVSEEGMGCVEDICYSSSLKYLMIRLKDNPNPQEFIKNISPDFSKLSNIDTKDMILLVIVTLKSDIVEGVIYTRHFAPWFGVNEDPVCGTAHTMLMPYWLRHFNNNVLKNNSLVSIQCSKRDGIVFCQSIGNRVQLKGFSKIVFSGTLYI